MMNKRYSADLKRVAVVLQDKKSLNPSQRLHAWQHTCSEQKLNGEFALAARLGEQGFCEEQARMVAELFGR